MIRKGKLLQAKRYLTIKDPYGRHADIHEYAPAGAEIVWDGEKSGTNVGYEDAYGGRFLYWITVVGYGVIGAEEGVDFEWTF